MFPAPRLSFACELDPARLVDLFADSAVIDDLLALEARVALMCSDFSDERAGVVRRLNAAGVPVTGIPLLPLAEGYYFTADNTDQAAGCYQQRVAWTRRHQLVWDGVGLDIEPDARIYLQIMNGPWGLLPMLAPRLLDRARPARSRQAYKKLVERIHADGWQAENYQFPLIADERQAGSALLQRLALVDAATDREVWMLYSSFLRALGPGLIWAYGPQAAAIAVGTTGGGPDIPGSPADAGIELGAASGGPAPGPALLRPDTDPQPGRMRLAGHPPPAPVVRVGRRRRTARRRTGRRGPAPRPARSLVGQRASLARAGHHSHRGLAHLALAPRMTFGREVECCLWGALEAPHPAAPGSRQLTPRAAPGQGHAEPVDLCACPASAYVPGVRVPKPVIGVKCRIRGTRKGLK